MRDEYEILYRLACDVSRTFESFRFVFNSRNESLNEIQRQYCRQEGGMLDLYISSYQSSMVLFDSVDWSTVFQRSDDLLAAVGIVHNEIEFGRIIVGMKRPVAEKFDMAMTQEVQELMKFVAILRRKSACVSSKHPVAEAEGGNPQFFVPDAIQEAVLHALRGKMLKIEEIAEQCCGGTPSRLYEGNPSRWNALQHYGLIKKHPEGFYSTKHPPENAINVGEKGPPPTKSTRKKRAKRKKN